MNCHQCKNHFDEYSFVPRLLIVCGHSFCDNCLTKIHNNGKIICPECHTSNFVECIASLPRNLALLNQKNESPPLLCQKHNKRYQAFCDKDKMLLCINCILEDVHRNHHQMIQPITSAYDKQKEKMNKQSCLLEKMYLKVQQELGKLEDAYQLGLKCFEDNQQAIERHFNEVRKIIQTEQETIKLKARDLFMNFEAKSKQRQAAYINNMEIMDEFVIEVSKSSLLSPEQYLERTRIRDSLNQKINDTFDPVSSFSGLIVNKNTVMDCLIKALEKNKSKQLKDSNARQRQTIKCDLSKAKVFNDKSKKPCLTKQNSNIRYPAKKYAKKQIKQKQPIKQAIYQPPVLVKRPQTSMQKPIPTEISGFQENHTMFKSFLSSNASFFIERRYVYVLGGFCQDSNSIIRLNLDTMKWDYVSSMMNRSKFGVAQVNKDIVILGGKRDKLRISSGETFKDNSLVNSWALDNIRSGFGIVVLNDELYVVGGNDGETILTTFERLSQYDNTWKRLDGLNEGRDELAVTVGRDSKIYAIGGFGGSESTCLRSVERYDTVTRRWEFTRPMQIPRRALSAVTLADGIYAIGGFDGQNYLNSVEKYDEYSNTWTMITGMKQARCTHSAVSIFQTQQILVFGGFDISPLASVEKYSVVTGTWEVVTDMPAPRFMHGCLYVKQ